MGYGVLEGGHARLVGQHIEVVHVWNELPELQRGGRNIRFGMLAAKEEGALRGGHGSHIGIAAAAFNGCGTMLPMSPGPEDLLAEVQRLQAQLQEMQSQLAEASKAKQQAQSELIANEQLLNATNQRLSQQVRLFESMEKLASVGYWTSTTEPGSLRWSSGMYRLCGIEPGTIHNTGKARSLIVPEDLHLFEAAREKPDGSVLEYRIAHPDGKIHWQRSRIQHWSGEGADEVDFGVVQDITAEREAAEALQEKLRFIEKITSRAPGMVFQLQLRPDGQYRFLYVSERVREIYRGITPQEVLANATCAVRLHHPQDLPGLFKSIADSAKTVSFWSHEYRLLFEDGEVKWLLGQAMPEREADGSIVWNGFTTDITQRKAAEDALRKSELRFRALTEWHACGAWPIRRCRDRYG